MAAKLTVSKMAKLLADQYRKEDPAVARVLWFPHRKVVRLFVVFDCSKIDDDDVAYECYCRPTHSKELPLPSAVIFYRHDNYSLPIPNEWGPEDAAKEI